jgi:hypothetical protein
LEIDRLAAATEDHRAEIVALSQSWYVLSPFTSLLVLENDEMDRRFKVDHDARQDHWAAYPCPDRIPVVKEPPAPQARAAAPGPAAGPLTREQGLRSILIPVPPRALAIAGRADPLQGRNCVTAWHL